MLKIYVTLLFIILLSLAVGIIIGISAKEANAIKVTASVIPNKCNQCISLCQQSTAQNANNIKK